MSPLRGFLIAAVVTGLAAIGILAITRSTHPPTPGQSKIQLPEKAKPQEQVVQAAPAFDIVRVAPDGTAVLAGRAEPKSDVALMLMPETELGRVKAGDDGNWSMIINDPLPTGNQELYLLAYLPDGQKLRSKHTVVVSITESRDRLPLVVLGSPGSASRVLQDPDHIPSSGELVLHTIDYDEVGGVVFAGEAKPSTTVRIISDGQLIGQVTADASGHWQMTSPVPLSEGVHKLQIDQIEESGRVSAVLVLPFKRESVATVQSVGPTSVVVQPGNSLWRIARRLYGQGMQYTVIYSANTDQIRDPDLIYPGQVLDLPKSDSTLGASK